MTGNFNNIVQAPLYPLYSDVAHAIRLMGGEPVQRGRDTLNAILEQTGTPQNPVDWSDPNTWIDERLSGELQTLTRKIWDGSEKALNPCFLTEHGADA